ncbi:hypothetical protein L210DRAFT_3761328 [Boletus edulis BED1]|uniref:Uncharacterized protein n=1 Tax=Boletus edulis BED1 TaxID=1328754 RepID=A0AAD4BS93_BOLED|nr:hypothetical protein L210DRAFT_3761328 [Boletus edulis BED1]
MQESDDYQGSEALLHHVPIGGLHYVYTTRFLLLTTTLAVEGYTISLLKFTGTFGFGDDYILKPVGRIGTLDIANWWIITGNLAGQYPGVFKAAVMINPVTSLGEFATSDLPDFRYAEIVPTQFIGRGVQRLPYRTRRQMTCVCQSRAGEGYDFEGAMEAIKSIRDWFKVHRAGDD